jgi:hypothetical protein
MITRRFLIALTLAMAIACGAWAVNWQTGAIGATGRPQFIFVKSANAESAALERDVIDQPIVGQFLDDFSCWRIDLDQVGGAAQALALGATSAPTLIVRSTAGHEEWRHEGAVSARELITALVIHGPAVGGAAPMAPAAQPAATATPPGDQPAGPPVATDPSGDASNPALDLVQATVSRAGDTLAVQTQVAGTAQVDGFHMYFNTDGNDTTGFNTANILGADCMIEGATVYRHAGANQNDWNWTNIGTASASASGSVLTERVPLSLLGIQSGQTINVSFATTDTNWQPVDWMPNSAPSPLTVP